MTGLLYRCILLCITFECPSGAACFFDRSVGARNVAGVSSETVETSHVNKGRDPDARTVCAKTTRASHTLEGSQPSETQTLLERQKGNKI